LGQGREGRQSKGGEFRSDGRRERDGDGDVGVVEFVYTWMGTGMGTSRYGMAHHSTAQHITAQPSVGLLSNPRHIRFNGWTIWSRRIRLGWAVDVAVHVVNKAVRQYINQ
jgi:hypothetical protein